jgi:hypothetical protein
MVSGSWLERNLSLPRTGLSRLHVVERDFPSCLGDLEDPQAPGANQGTLAAGVAVSKDKRTNLQ